MIFTETRLQGAFIIDIEPIEDERGFFARSWCRNEFEAHGLTPDFVQCNISFNKKKGTLRGLHYQDEPNQEVKLVRCTRGSLFDVIVDLRAESKTFREWINVELSASNHRMLYVPKGFAHGFQTLEDNTEVFYQMSEFYRPESVRGVHWNDPSLAIAWPFPMTVMSENDSSCKLL